VATSSSRSLATSLAVLAVVAVSAGGQSPTAPGPAKTKSALAKLRVVPVDSGSGYRRTRFGSGWASSPGGCNTRKLVLLRDGQDARKGSGCRIIGRWRSFYDGMEFTSSSKLDIDHVIPLAEAWRSGAREWSQDERKRFANDLSSPQLVAVSYSANRSKGDKGPENWKPRRAAWCLYARWWVAVKSVWKLAVDAAEKRAVSTMLNTCS
jgi:hypothetical protein